MSGGESPALIADPFRADLEAEIEMLREQIAAQVTKMAFLERVLAGTEPAHSMPDHFIPRVSDHAVVQYLARARGVDIDAVRDEILTPAREKSVRAGCHAIRDGNLIFLVRRGTFVTVLRADWSEHRMSREARAAVTLYKGDGE